MWLFKLNFIDMIYEDLLYTSLPILGSDGRLRIYLKFEDGSHKGMSFPKFVMENYLGRPHPRII